jgi:hypothetical protein
MITFLLLTFLNANEIYNNSKAHLTVSKSCAKKNAWTQCMAIKPLQKIIPYTYINGIENGSAICNTLENAKVAFLLDKKRNMRSICKFTDKSWIDLGSLEYYVLNKKTLPVTP